jgi:hypothetical protein
MLRFRIPDILLGAILGVATLGMAIFAMGFVLGSSQYSGQPTQSQGPEKTSASESKNEQQEPWWQRAATDPIAVFTLCLVLIGAFQVGLFYVQLKIIRESLVDAKKAANAADVSAKAAKVSADGFMNAERPYIYINSIQPLLGIEYFPGITAGPNRVTRIAELKVVVKNYGRTPAIIKQISSQLRLSKDNPPMTLSVIPGQFIIIERDGTYSFDVPMGYELIEGTAMLLRDGEIKFWLHFLFIYRDIFGDPHETAGRWSYSLASRNWDGEYEKAT